MVWSNKFTSPATWPLNLIFAIASFQLVERAIPTRDILVVQMLKQFGRCWGYWGGGGCDFQSLLYVLISHCSSHYFLGCFASDLGGTMCPFGPRGPRCRRDWEVNTIKYPRSLVYLKFGEAKLEIWLNNCWKVRVKLEHQSLFQWNYSNRLFGMVSSTLHVYTITSVVNLCEEKLPLSLYSIL